MFAYLQDHAMKNYHTVKFGEFGADMQVALINDGPVTFTLTVSGG
jgi:D-tyrosyl-tRNA(Tyr) deacylase